MDFWWNLLIYYQHNICIPDSLIDRYSPQNITWQHGFGYNYNRELKKKGKDNTPMCDEFNMVNQIVVRHMTYTVIRCMTYNGHRAYAKYSHTAYDLYSHAVNDLYGHTAYELYGHTTHFLCGHKAYYLYGPTRWPIRCMTSTLYDLMRHCMTCLVIQHMSYT